MIDKEHWQEHHFVRPNLFLENDARLHFSLINIHKSIQVISNFVARPSTLHSVVKRFHDITYGKGKASTSQSPAVGLRTTNFFYLGRQGHDLPLIG